MNRIVLSVVFFLCFQASGYGCVCEIEDVKYKVDSAGLIVAGKVLRIDEFVVHPSPETLDDWGLSFYTKRKAVVEVLDRYKGQTSTDTIELVESCCTHLRLNDIYLFYIYTMKIEEERSWKAYLKSYGVNWDSDIFQLNQEYILSSDHPGFDEEVRRIKEILK